MSEPTKNSAALPKEARVVRVELGERAYDIVIQPELIPACGTLLREALPGRRCLVITDRTVGPKYGPKLAKSLQVAGFDGSLAEIPPGEGTKTLDTAKFLYDRCIDAKLDRDSCIIALGGGVIGDLAGYVAATFYRGIPFVQIPTTLLAMVDAAIGGKTGVDLPMAKNAVGAFHQPKAVLIDPLTLLTLDDRELKAGLAEVIKYGVIDDRELFDFLERSMPAILEKDAPALAHIIEKSAAIKARIVAGDEFERHGGNRALLNLGHTFGHALESTTQYIKYLHGEAVAVGICQAAELSVQLELLSRADRDRIVALIEKAGLPTKLKDNDPDDDTLYQAMFKDKKVAQGKLRFIVAEAIGKAKTITDVPEKSVRDALTWSRG
jgi:3-dehydroquinate synthase